MGPMSDDLTRVEVSDRCIGSGLCLALAPRHFEFAGARAKATTGVIERPEDLEDVHAAADVCPASAIAIAGPQ